MLSRGAPERPVPLRVPALLTIMAGLLLAACASPSATSEVDESVQLAVAIGLVRDQAGLEKHAIEVNNPGGSEYGTYLTQTEIADKYGASKSDADKLLEYLKDGGVDGDLQANGGLVMANMTVGQAEDLLNATFSDFKSTSGTRYVSGKAGSLPGEIKDVVDDVAGLAHTVPSATPTPEVSAPDLDPAATSDCGDTQPRVEIEAIHEELGIDGLTARGATGAGMRVAITAIEAFDAQSYAEWTACLGISPPQPQVKTVQSADLGLPGENEIDLDLDTIVAAVPDLAAIDIYEFNSFGWMGSPIAAAINVTDAADLPDAIVSSVVFCELGLEEEQAHLSDWVLAAAATSGVPVVAAAGDRGSSGCYPSKKALAVQRPASSPFAVAAGGTQQGSSSEGDGGENEPEVWYEKSQELAGGGGTSTFGTRPGYQAQVDISGSARVVPDFAGPADPNAAPALPICDRVTGTCSWTRVGGTSMTAPLVTAGLLQMRQLLEAQGKPGPGFVNPLVYGLDGADRARVFTDIPSGTNDLFDVGCCSSKPGFDAVTGWGAVDLDALYDVINTVAPQSR